MASDKEIEAGAKAIADDMMLPGGGLKKLARVVGERLDWFDLVEARGLTWGDISRLLFSAGAKGSNGRPISIGTLSSTVWRKRDSAKASPKPVPAEVRPQQPSPNNSTGKPKAIVRKPRADHGSVLKQKHSSTRPPRERALETAPRKTEETSLKPLTSSQPELTSKAQTRAFMKRAAAIRRARTD